MSYKFRFRLLQSNKQTFILFSKFFTLKHDFGSSFIFKTLTLRCHNFFIKSIIQKNILKYLNIIKKIK